MDWEVKCEYQEMVDIETVLFKASPKNPNFHSKEQIKRLAKILEYQGWRSPIIISNRSGFITAGHGRLLAAQHSGQKQVPIDRQDYPSDEAEYAHIVSDNSIASWAELDLSMINTEFTDMGPDFDLELLGLKDFRVDPKFDMEKDKEKKPKKCPECGHEF